METKQQLQDHLVMLKKKLAELKSKKISISQNRSNKYRQFGDELVNTDTNAAGKFYSMADNIDSKQDDIDMQQAKLLLSTGTKADVGELQQLWKDNKRFMTQVAAKRGTSNDEYIQAKHLQTNIETKLQTLAPDIWDAGEAPKKKVELTDAEKKLKADELKTFEDTSIRSQLVDENKDGISDVPLADVKLNITKFVKANGYGEDQATILNTFAKDLVDNIQTSNATRLSNSEKKQALANKAQNQKFSIADKVASIGMIMGGLKAIDENPTNYGEIQNLLTSLLRKESGAAIAPDEVVTRMKGSLPPKARKELEDRLTGTGKIIKGILSKEWSDASDQRVLYEYIPQMDMEQFKRVLMDGLNTEAVAKWNEANKADTDGTDKADGAPERKQIAGDWYVKNAQGEWIEE